MLWDDVGAEPIQERVRPDSSQERGCFQEGPRGGWQPVNPGQQHAAEGIRYGVSSTRTPTFDHGLREFFHKQRIALSLRHNHLHHGIRSDWPPVTARATVWLSWGLSGCRAMCVTYDLVSQGG